MNTTAQSILLHAPDVFATHGFEGASTRKLAAAAGVNIATLAYHFGDKQGLYEACLDAVYERLFSHPLPATPPGDTTDRLHSVIDAIYIAALAERNGIRMLLRHVMSQGSLPLSIRMKWTSRTLEQVKEILALLGLTEVDRLTLLSLNHLIARYAVSETADISPFVEGEDPHEAVVAHLTKVATVMLGLNPDAP